MPRGALATLLYALTRNSAVRYRFDNSIEAIEDDGARVDVRFRSGERRHYDIVVGADGMHSNVRRLVFGPEAPFNRYLGYTFNLFSMPNDWGLSHGAIVYAEAGRAAGAFAVRDSPKVFSFLIFATERPPFSVNPSVAEQIERTAAVFADHGWEVPRLLEAMRHADDLFFDTVVRSGCRAGPRGVWAWSATPRSRRPSYQARARASRWSVPMCWRESSLRMTTRSMRSRLTSVPCARSPRPTRPWRPRRADRSLPRTQEQLDVRNRVLASLASRGPAKMPGGNARDVHNALRLPDYER